jgi:hypothetical protein
MPRMIGRLKTVVLDAADMDAEAQFWSAVLDVPVVYRGDDWTTLEGRGVRLAVQLAPDHVPPRWPDPERPQQLHLDVHVEDATTRSGGCWRSARPGCRTRRVRRTSACSPIRQATRSAWCSSSDEGNGGADRPVRHRS